MVSVKRLCLFALVVILGCGGGGAALGPGNGGGGGGGSLFGSWHGTLTESQKKVFLDEFTYYATGNANIKFLVDGSVDMWGTYRTDDGLDSGQRHFVGNLSGSTFTGQIVPAGHVVTGTITKQGTTVFLSIQWKQNNTFKKSEAQLTYDEFQ